MVAVGLALLSGRVATPDGYREDRNAMGLAGDGPPAFVPTEDDPPPPEEEPADDGPPILDPASIPPGKAIRGVVKDKEGKLLANAIVRALKPIPRKSELEKVAETRTTADGAFVVGPVDERVVVDAVAEGFFRARKWARGGESVEFELGKPGILSGVVTYDGTGKPCADAFLKLWHHEGEGGGELHTDAAGVFRFADLPPGRYGLRLMPANSPSLSLNDVEIKAEEETVRDLVVVEGVKVVGRVTDAETSEPVVGAEVSIQGNERLVGTTDADGRYEVLGFGTERSRVGVRAKGYLQTWAQVMPRAEGGDVTCDVKLKKGGSVRGLVLGPEGEPVSNAKIVYNYWSLRNQNAEFALSGDDGTFLLEGVPPGKRIIYAQVEGFAPGAAEGIEVRAAAETSGAEIRLTLGGGITGTLTNVKGEPVADVSVRIWATARGRIRIYPPEPVKTKEDGTFLFEHVRPGTYGAQVVAEDYQAERRLSIVVAEGAVVTGIDFVLQKGTFIEGKILSEDGKPIEGATIHAWPQQRGRSGNWQPVKGKSKADGAFRLDGLEAGTYYLNVTKAGFGNATQSQLQTGTSGIEIRLKDQGALTGTVVVGHGGKPAASAKVVVYVIHERGIWANRTVNVADPKGKFSIKGLPPGRYELEATTGSGMLSPRVPVEIREGVEPLPVTLTLGAGGSISGTVLTPEGLPAKGASVQAVPQPADPQNRSLGSSRTDAEGRFVIRPVRPGNYLVRAQHGQWSPCQEFVAVSEGSDISVALSLRLGGSFRLIVRGPQGEPIVGASILVKNSTGQNHNPDWNRYHRLYQEMRRSDPGLQWGEFWRILTTTNEQGVTERGFLVSDVYTVGVRAKGYRPGEVIIQVREGRETTQTLELARVPEKPPDGPSDDPNAPPPR